MCIYILIYISDMHVIHKLCIKPITSQLWDGMGVQGCCRNLVRSGRLNIPISLQGNKHEGFLDPYSHIKASQKGGGYPQIIQIMNNTIYIHIYIHTSIHPYI